MYGNDRGSGRSHHGGPGGGANGNHRRNAHDRRAWNDDRRTGATTGGTGMPAPDGQAGVATVGQSPLRRLGKNELHNTLRDLFPTLATDFDTKIDVPRTTTSSSRSRFPERCPISK